MTDMRDVESIRPTDEAIDAEFDAQRRESVFHEVQARARVVPIRRSRRWPAGVAAAVAGLAVLGLAAQALVTLNGQSVADPPVAGVTAASSAAPASPPDEPSPRYVSAVAMLGPVAVAAAAAPVGEPDAFLHVVRVEEQHSVAGQGSSQEPMPVDSDVTYFDDYIDRDGWLWSRRTGDQQFWLLTGQDQSTITSLPTDPDALDAALRSGTGNNSADERVFKGIHEILLTETAPPELRGAAITVLQRIAEHPQAAETTKDGQTATPTMTVTEVDLDGVTGYRAAMTDPTSRPGVERWLVLDATGQIMGSGTLTPELSFSSRITTREWVDALPSDFVDVLGTDHVERDINS